MALVRSVVHVECDWNAGSSFLIKVWANFLPFHHLDATYQYISSLLPFIFRLLYTINLEWSFSVFNFTERVHKTRFHWCNHLICVHDSRLNSVDKMAFDIDGILYIFTTKGNATSLLLSNTHILWPVAKRVNSNLFTIEYILVNSTLKVLQHARDVEECLWST